MSLPTHQHSWSFEQGFFPSQPLTGNRTIPGTVRSGSGFWLKGANWKSDTGHSSAGSAGATLSALQLIGGNHGGVTTNGNLALHASTTWAIAASSGTGYVNGSALTNAVTTSLKLLISGALQTAGLAKPDAPTVAVSATASGKMSGSYSFAVAAYRSTTGAIGNRSNPSAVIAVNGFKVRLTFPATVTGQTHWIVYGSPKSFGSVGPWFRITNIAIVPIATTVLDGADGVEYFNGELGDIAPTTNDVPPVGTHCAALGSVMCVVGSYGGYGISPSKVGEPEAYDVSQTSFLASRESVTAVTARGTDGGIFVATRNSISLIILSGSSVTPVLPRGVFESVGVASGNAMCWVHDTLYIFSSDGSLCRTHGSKEPDYSFAVPVQQYFKDNGFTGSNTYLIFDEKNGALLVCSGAKAVPYMLATGRWSVPITLPGTVTGGIAQAGSGLVAVGAALYTLNSASSTPAVTAFLQSPYEGVRNKILTTVEVQATNEVGIIVDLFHLTGSSEASIGGLLPFTHDTYDEDPRRPLFRYKNISCKVSTTSGNKEPNFVSLLSTVEPMLA
jgi:hypothetical protein